MIVSSHFHMDSSSVVFIYSVFGFIGVLVQLSFGVLLYYVGDVELMVFGIMVMAAACVMMLFPHSITSEGRFFTAIGLMYSVG